MDTESRHANGKIDRWFHCGRWKNLRHCPDRDFVEDQDPKTLEARSLDYYREEQVSESLQEALYSMP